jgi:hypothetical protein
MSPIVLQLASTGTNALNAACQHLMAEQVSILSGLGPQA